MENRMQLNDEALENVVGGVKITATTVTNKDTGEQYRQFVCNICPEPLVLTYKDGRHYHEYARPMTLEQAKKKIAENVGRYFAGNPNIEYTQWGADYLEARVHYPIKDDNERVVAELSKINDEEN